MWKVITMDWKLVTMAMNIPVLEHLKKVINRVRNKLWFMPDSPFAVHLSKGIDFPTKIGLGIVTHNNLQQLEICLKSIRRTNLVDGQTITIVVFNDRQQKLPNALLQKSGNDIFRILENSQFKFRGDTDNLFGKGIGKLLEIDRFDVVGLFDENVIFHPDWLLQTIRIALWAKQHHKRDIIGAFSPMDLSHYVACQGFGSHPCPDSGNYIIREQISLLHKLYFANDLHRLKFDNYAGDKNILSYLNSRKIRCLHTRISYVDYNQKNTELDTRPAPIKELLYIRNLISHGWGVEMKQADSLGFYKFLKKNQSFGKNIRSYAILDILITAIEKDIETLPRVIYGLRQYLQHPIGDIYIVAPSSLIIRKFCHDNNIKYVSEEGILPFQKADLNYECHGIDRSGWLFQQFLKLSGGEICSQEFILVIDADTFFVAPQVFIWDGKMVLLHSDEHHQPYFDVYQKLFGAFAPTSLSFVAHQMLFSKQKLGKLKEEIEERHGDTWHNVILSHIDIDECSAFSEYETYGQWILANYPDEVHREYWFNCSMNRFQSDWGSNNEDTPYRSVSIHVHADSF